MIGSFKQILEVNVSFIIKYSTSSLSSSLFRINNESTRIICEISSMLKMKTPEQGH